MLKRLLLAGLLLVCGEGARAAIIVTLDHVTDFDWVYNVSLQSSAFMSVGDAFTVYDFPGLQEAVFTPDAGPATRWPQLSSSRRPARALLRPS